MAGSTTLRVGGGKVGQMELLFGANRTSTERERSGKSRAVGIGTGTGTGRGGGLGLILSEREMWRRRS